MKKLVHLIILFLIYKCDPLFGQSIYGDIWVTTHELMLDEPPCSCSIESICGGSSTTQDAATFSYEGVYYGGGNPSILEKDPLTCDWTWVTPMWSPQNLAGLVSINDGIFYAIELPGSNNAIYKIDIINDTYSILGYSPFQIANEISDLCSYNGEVYYMSADGLVRLNITTPESSQLLHPVPDSEHYDGLTASPWCNTLLATYEEPGWSFAEIGW
jgi:hypothetical protein